MIYHILDHRLGTLNQMLYDSTVQYPRCVVTGFDIGIIKGIVMDRVWDDGEYCVDDVMLLWGPCNYAKAKVPFFTTKANFLEYKALLGLNDMSHRKAAVLIVREPLERLREFQRAKRHTD
jgi:hypothetical protein